MNVVFVWTKTTIRGPILIIFGMYIGIDNRNKYVYKILKNVGTRRDLVL